VYNFLVLLLYVIKFQNICKIFFLFFDNYLLNKYIYIRSELDDNQIQQLFQQLIQRLIFYISINSKQITIKLIVAVNKSFFLFYLTISIFS
jgi:hypothetical protein